LTPLCVLSRRRHLRVCCCQSVSSSKSGANSRDGVSGLPIHQWSTAAAVVKRRCQCLRGSWHNAVLTALHSYHWNLWQGQPRLLQLLLPLLMLCQAPSSAAAAAAAAAIMSVSHCKTGRSGAPLFGQLHEHSSCCKRPHLCILQ
jgi:hypothetical protein